MNNKGRLLLIMGPSGVGKTTVIRELRAMDPRFVYVCPYTTRTERPGETDKIPVSAGRFQQMSREGAFVAVNYLYGASYGTPKDTIEWSLDDNKFPLLDWPIKEAASISRRLDGRVYRVYISPPSQGVLCQRLSDGRDPYGERTGTAMAELEAVARGEYNHVIDHRVISLNGMVESVAQEIYAHYTEALKSNSGGDGSAEATLALKIKLKNDRHRKVRGGSARLVEIVCVECGELVLLYQKDGKGHLFRCYINRIFAPVDLAALQVNLAARTPASLPVLTCRSCYTVIGTPMRHTDGRLAFRLIHGRFRNQPPLCGVDEDIDGLTNSDMNTATNRRCKNG
jgi:guanylate kinase